MSYCGDTWFLSCSSKEEFRQKYKLCISAEITKIKDLFFNVLEHLKQKIIEADLCGFKQFIDFIHVIHDEAPAEKIYPANENPFRNNLVILVCQSNNVPFLEYVLENMDVLSRCIGNNNPKPADQDECCHNAFYYAIRSNNMNLLETLIIKWPNQYFSQHQDRLEDIIQAAYHELLLKNVYLSDETKFFVEGKLLDLRFFSKNSEKPFDQASHFKNIKERISLITDKIDALEKIQSNVDAKFICIAKFLAKNIFILKGLLKSTYSDIPWEEIEFCLLCFILYKTKYNKLNMFYCQSLPPHKIIDHLKTFSRKLREFKNTVTAANVGRLRKLPQVPRDKLVTEIAKRNPQFANLYNDYKPIRDITSLQTINKYAGIASKADPNTLEGQLIITRALIIIGEHLKNTLESPKLSKTASELLLVSLPKGTANILRRLRNSLAHGDTMVLRMVIEEQSSDTFSNIKTDFDKLCRAIKNIVIGYENRHMRKLLQEISRLDDIAHLKNMSEMLSYFDVKEIFIGVNESLTNEGKIRDRLKKIIKDQSLCQKLDEMPCIFTDDEDVEKNLILKQTILGLKTLTDLDYMKIDENSLRNYQFKIKVILENNNSPHEISSSDKIDTSFITKLLQEIKLQTEPKKIADLTKLSIQLIHMIESQHNDVNFLTEFNDVLKYYKFYMDDYSSNDYKIVNYNETELLKKKLSQIEHFLYENGLSNFSKKKYSSYKNDDNLQILLEMLLLDCLSILETTKTAPSYNIYSFDQKHPSLFGRALRNHLAHVNLLVDVVCEDFSLTLLINCHTFLKTIPLLNKEDIGRYSIRQDNGVILNEDLSVIDLQEKMFKVVEIGYLSELRCCIVLGADIHGRDMNLRTAIHYAAKCSSIEVMEFLVKQKVGINVTDIYGQTPLHVSASTGCKSTTEYLIRQKLICIDSRDNSHRTALHLASKKGHKEIVVLLLTNGAKHYLLDLQGRSPLHKAVEQDHVGITKILLGQDISTESNEVRGGFTALHLAAELGSFETTKLLLEQGANVNAKTAKNASALHFAALNGHTNIVEALIEAGADVHAKFSAGGTSLHNAVETGRDRIVEILIRSGADVNVSYSGYKTTPLHFAVQKERENILKLLLQNGANINAPDQSLKTPLHFAAETGNVNILMNLLSAEANIKAKDQTGHTALHVAIENGHNVVTEILLRKGIDINTPIFNGTTPLHLSAMKGNVQISALLIENGAIIDYRDKNGRQPLHVAAQCGHVEVIDIFVQNGSNVNIKDSAGTTPILLAILNGHFHATEYLLKNKAQVSWYNNNKLSPLSCAISGNHLDILNLLLEHDKCLIYESCSDYTPLQLAVQQTNKEIIKLLLKHGSNINENGKNGMTALCYAVERNDEMIVDFVIKNGADVKAGNNKALFLAVAYGFKEIVEILLRNGAQSNVIGSENYTPLDIAVAKGQTHVVQMLIENGSKINVRGELRMTPLIKAVIFGHKDIVNVLLKKGANPNHCDLSGWTSLHYAAAVSKNAGIVEMLLKYGANISAKEDKNRMAIELAVAHNCIDIVRLLLSNANNFKINNRGNDNYTLLHIAAENGCSEIVQMLIQNGADIHSRNTKGSKPIHLASREGFKETVELLLNSGCQIEETGVFNQTLLHYAAFNGKLVEFLLSKAANPNAVDSNGLTPLHVAASLSNSKEAVEVLLANGAIYNSVDSMGRTPLMASRSLEIINILESTKKLFKSVKRGKSSKIENLLKLGAFINARDSDGYTPLHFAVWKNFEDVVQTLLKHKAHPSIANNKGGTPLHYASKFSHLNVTKILLSNGAMFDVKSVYGRTPSDMATDKDIVKVLKQVGKTFQSIESQKIHIIHELVALRDIELLKIIMNARNSNNECLITLAMRIRFPLVNHLKNILQKDHLSKVIEAARLIDNDDTQKALYLLRPIFEERKILLGADNPATLDLQELICKALYKSNLYESALTLLRDLLNKQEKIFGKISKSVLLTNNIIALILHRQEKNQEAFEIYQKICPQLEQTVGIDDQDTLEAKSHMALVLQRLGKYNQALDLNREVLSKWREKYAVTDKFTVTTLNNIAMLLMNQNKYEEALDIYEQVYEEKKSIFGVNHTSTLNTKHSIGSVYAAQENFHKATEIWKELLEVQKGRFMPGHHVNLRVQMSLAQLYFLQNKYISAYEHFREVLEFDKSGIFSTEASVFMCSIINTLQTQGDFGTIDVIGNHQKNLNTACSLGESATVEELLKYGGNINSQDASGCSALHHAASNGHLNVVVTLLQSGADPTIITQKSNTTLHLAASKGFSNVAVELLKHIKSDKLKDCVNAGTSGTGSTALHIAAQKGFFATVISLLTYNAIYNIKNYKNQTPFEICKDKRIQTLLIDVDTYFEAAKYGKLNILEKIRLRDKDEIRAILGANNEDRCSLVEVANYHKQKNLAKGLAKLMQNASL